MRRLSQTVARGPLAHVGTLESVGRALARGCMPGHLNSRRVIRGRQPKVDACFDRGISIQRSRDDNLRECRAMATVEVGAEAATLKVADGSAR